MPRLREPIAIVCFVSLLVGACGSAPGPIEPPLADGTVVAAAGDIACPGEPCSGQRSTADLVREIDPDVVLALGDLQYPHGLLEDFRSSYGPTWGAFRGRTHPVPGNHEYHAPGASGYFAYFGASAHQEQGGWYSVDVGDWHVVAVNTGTGTVSEEQVAWIERDLAEDDHRCELAFWHHPRFSSGTKHGSNERLDALWRSLHAAGVDVVLTGHEHHYERFAPLGPDGAPNPSRGIRQFVVGTGGRSLYPFGTPLPGSEARIGDALGVLRIVLQEKGYVWSFLDVDGNVLDEGSGACHT